MFIATYLHDFRTSHGMTELRRTAPWKVMAPSFPKEIESVSKNFVQIFAQAERAQALEMTHIAGGGYRKALEFLIKDYCVSRTPNERDDIEREWLMKTILERFEDNLVRACAKRAAWLGNDELHYIRKWTSKDVTHLKELIQLTVNGIHSLMLAEQYQTEMPD